VLSIKFKLLSLLTKSIKAIRTQRRITTVLVANSASVVPTKPTNTGIDFLKDISLSLDIPLSWNRKQKPKLSESVSPNTCFTTFGLYTKEFRFLRVMSDDLDLCAVRDATNNANDQLKTTSAKKTTSRSQALWKSKGTHL